MTGLLLSLALAASPKVLIAEGEHEGVPKATVQAMLDDARRRATAAHLTVADERAICAKRSDCVALSAKVGTDAFVIVSMFAGAKGVTLDLDARLADGAKLDVLTANLGRGATTLPAAADALFALVAQKVTPPAREPEPQPEPQHTQVPPPLFTEEAPVVVPSSPSVRSRAWWPLVPGAAFAVASAALIVDAFVVDSQIRGGDAQFASRLDGAVNQGKLSQTLGYTALGLAVACVATAAAMYLFGAPGESDVSAWSFSAATRSFTSGAR